MTFDAGGIFGDEPGKEGLPLFNDTTSDPLIAGSTLALTTEKQIGFLLVEVLASDNTASGDSDEDGDGGELYWPDGEALILDLANGGAWGYKASNEPFENIYHYEQAWLCSAEDCFRTAAPVLVHPPSVATTELVITPISDGIIDSLGGYASGVGSAFANMSVIIQPVANDIPTASVYDRNENLLSATREKKVTCVGVATLDELLSAGILNNPAFQEQGGWGWLWNKPFDVDGDNDVETEEQNMAFVYKVESSSELGFFMINGIPNGNGNNGGLCVDFDFDIGGFACPSVD